ncbi:DNA-3-methyladenine glycosylase I [Companilactobacillus kedongensis]|uniref:DNA-3-methyladenine glycosylase I n=1 Tax=Companilactobacillus kedongensis TaxID=2486004 RepID=UPI000F79B4A2|nr:DNA-3-methyladenine glycosylase I [Companilactobacillus kedongensis]
MRCSWADSSEEMQLYHDTEWGKIDRDERYLFEMLSLELSQAGLSWSTILKRRSGYKEVFDNFDVDKVAGYSDEKISELLQDPKIIRNKLKVNAIVNNAKQIKMMHDNNKRFGDYIWNFVDNKQIINHYQTMEELPAQDELSQKISKDLKKRGFKFIGPTIIYSFLQAIGVINDHLDSCDFK